MKKTVLVTGGTSNDAPAMAVLLLNLRDINNKLTDDIIIFHDGISERDQVIMKSIMPVQFRLYNYQGNIENFKEVVKNYFSTMIFCKYECFNLLNEYRTVIWTDYDVVLNNDISELLTLVPSGFRMMPDINNTVLSMFSDDIDDTIKNYNLDIAGICMPIFVFYDNMHKYNEYYEYCLRQTDKHSKYLYLPEQCIINLLLQDYNINIEPIDYHIYCAHPNQEEITESTKVIHAYGQPKFWNGLHNTVWEKNYREWVRMGGSNFFCRKISYKIYNNIKKIFKLLLPSFVYQRMKYLYKKIGLNKGT
jgi:lipopolysaccharide biosynthesis glycosyltransferase